jgi:hypothetical protein
MPKRAQHFAHGIGRPLEATVYTQVSNKKRSPSNLEKRAIRKKKQSRFVLETGILAKND